MSTSTLIILVLIGLFAGTLSGMLGVGGAIIVVPSLVFFIGLTQLQAQGTSLALMSLPIFWVGVWQYYKAGNIDWRILIPLAVAFIVGTYLGSKVAMHVDQKILSKLFALFLLFVSLRMIFTK